MGIAGSKQGTLADAAPIYEDNIAGEDVQEQPLSMKRRRSLSPVSPPQKRLRGLNSPIGQASQVMLQGCHAIQIPAVARVEIPSSRSLSPERLDRSKSETNAQALEQSSQSDTTPSQTLGIGVKGTELAQTTATIHAAASDDSRLQDTSDIPLTLMQLEMNRKLLQKAVMSLQDETFRGTDLQQPVIGTRLEAPHHRLRDGRLPWQVIKESDMPCKSAEACNSHRKRTCQDDDQDSLRMRKRLRKTMKDDLMSEYNLEMPSRGMERRQRTLTGAWPRDGIGGLERRGDLVRRS